jgi:hypothetical protein
MSTTIPARERLRVILAFALNHNGSLGWGWTVGQWRRGVLVARWRRPTSMRPDAHPTLVLTVEDYTRDGERWRGYSIQTEGREIEAGGDWGAWRGWVEDLACSIVEGAERAPFLKVCGACRGHGSADYFHCGECDGQGQFDVRDAA